MNGKYLNPKTGKRVSGAAAQQMFIKNNGGWESHHKKFENMIKEDLTEKFLSLLETEFSEDIEQHNIRLMEFSEDIEQRNLAN